MSAKIAIRPSHGTTFPPRARYGSSSSLPRKQHGSSFVSKSCSACSPSFIQLCVYQWRRRQWNFCSFSYPSLDRAKDKVLCVCGTTINDGKPMVECTSCGAWSHLHCSRLTQRTAKKAIFKCHRCKGALSKATCTGEVKRKSGLWECQAWFEPTTKS